MSVPRCSLDGTYFPFPLFSVSVGALSSLLATVFEEAALLPNPPLYSLCPVSVFNDAQFVVNFRHFIICFILLFEDFSTFHIVMAPQAPAELLGALSFALSSPSLIGSLLVFAIMLGNFLWGSKLLFYVFGPCDIAEKFLRAERPLMRIFSCCCYLIYGLMSFSWLLKCDYMLSLTKKEDFYWSVQKMKNSPFSINS